MFLRVIFFLFLFLQLCPAGAQDAQLVNVGFESMMVSDLTGRGTQFSTFGSLEYTCGVVGDALLMDGDDYIVMDSTVNNVFGTSSFSLSFYFKPTLRAGDQNILSKRQVCVDERALAITYLGNSHELRVVVAENTTKNTIFSVPLADNRCWYQVTLVKDDRQTLVYINGELEASGNSVARIDLANPESLVIAGGPCIGVSESRFEGYIDEFIVYDRVLDRNEIRSRYVKPDAVATRDTLIFVGNTVPLNVNNTCVSNITWAPASEIVNPNQSSTEFNPSAEGTFNVYANFRDEDGCVASDTVRVVVVDPANLECDVLFLPNAFTPNGDGINDLYGIDNPFAMESLTNFEIFDRLGNRVFVTEDRFGKWDGLFKGNKLSPGVFVYRIQYICRGENTTATGSFTLLN